MTREEFIKKHEAQIISSTYGTGILPSVKAAQMIVESSTTGGTAGGSSLSKKYNNYFGIKADKSWKGKSVVKSTDEVFNGVRETIKDGFRVYDSAMESTFDHTRFLLENKRYKYALKAKTPEEQARALQAAGYATAPDYADTLISIINRNNLKRLDPLKPIMQRLETFIAIIGILILAYFLLKTLNINI